METRIYYTGGKTEELGLSNPQSLEKQKIFFKRQEKEKKNLLI